MPALRALRLLNAVEAGTTTGAQLEALLIADPGRLSDWNTMLVQRGTMRRMAASSTAMAAVAASSTAMAAVIASSTAMAAVWASNTAADAVLTSSTAKLAVYNADTALAALQANPTQVQRQITTRATLASTSNPSQVFVASGTKVILLRRYYGAAGEYDMINWARGSTTAATGQGPTAGSGGRQLDTGAAAQGCISGTYTSTGTDPANDATGNFVAAANGLQRRSWGVGYALNVAYLLV